MTAESTTGQRDLQYADIDLRPTLELVELLNDEDARVASAVRECAVELAAAIDAIVERLGRGGRLVYVGAGSSGRLAWLDAEECVPTFGLAPGRVLALAAADGPAEDDEQAGAEVAAAALIAPADAVVAVSASGATPYTLGAARAAAAAGALTIAVVNVPGSPLGALVEHELLATTGPEVVAGSTRLKAGTAQKLILNTISTATMIRLGRTYGNLMVGVVASNDKLRERARRTVELATGLADERVDEALAAAGADAKIAIVALLTGLDAGAAARRLDAAGGAVRRALEGA